MDEDRQGEQSSLDFVTAVAMLRSLNELPEDPSGSCKICGFCVASEDDDQPASSYRLPVGGTFGISSLILMNVSRHLLWPCTPRRCRNFSSNRVYPAVASTRIPQLTTSSVTD